jgi:uncharacterized membrane protein
MIMSNWKQKLTSRKFWLSIVGFITPLVLAFGVSEAQAAQIASIVMSGASVVAYIIGEGFADSKRAENTTNT